MTTFAVQDAPALARGALKAARLEKSALVLAAGEDSGTVEGPSLEASAPFDRACVSVNAETPGDSRVEVAVKALAGDRATEWLPMGVVAAPDDAARLPRSAEKTPSPAEKPASGAAAKVEIDTVVLPEGNGRALTVRLVLHRSRGGETPRVRRVALVAWPHGKRAGPEAGSEPHPAWGKVLEVVERSQRVEDPRISGRICSATSLGMVLAFHGFELATKDVCREVLDREAGIYGNWALNVAFAGRLGLSASIVRMETFRPLEDEIAAGRPVVITHRWTQGQLSGAPIGSTDGHLIVVRGFTKEGDLVVNDPAADPRKGQEIERVYKRAEISKTWLENADGIAYVLSRDAAR